MADALEKRARSKVKFRGDFSSPTISPNSSVIFARWPNPQRVFCARRERKESVTFLLLCSTTDIHAWEAAGHAETAVCATNNEHIRLMVQASTNSPNPASESLSSDAKYVVQFFPCPGLDQLGTTLVSPAATIGCKAPSRPLLYPITPRA